jgi:hypothetical protein
VPRGLGLGITARSGGLRDLAQGSLSGLNDLRYGTRGLYGNWPIDSTPGGLGNRAEQIACRTCLAVFIGYIFVNG